MNYKVTDIVNAEPCYTGGGIYAIVGELADGNYFMGDLTFHWIVVVNEKPDWDESWYEEWIDAHKVTEFNDDDARKFIAVALQWVKANKPNGNYSMSDMDDILEELAEGCKDNETDPCYYIAYSKERDITFVMRETDGEITVSGFYFGEPNETATELYKEKPTAEKW